MFHLLLQIVKTSVKSNQDTFFFTKMYIPDFVEWKKELLM